MKKTCFLWIALLLLIPVMTASGAPREVLKVGVKMFNKYMDPGCSSSNNASQYHINLHDGLVRLSTMGQPYKVLPAIATSWKEISQTVTEFKLRKGAKFWDGTYITAEDVKWSLERTINKVHPKYTGAYSRYLYNFEKVEIVDASTVRVHTKRPEPLKYIILGNAPSAILSKKAFDAAASPEEYFNQPVGSGPYRIAEYKQDSYWKFESWEGYWGEKQPLKELWYYFIPETASRITALANGEIDLAVDIPPDQKSALEGKKGIKAYGFSLDMFILWVFNQTHKPVNDQRIRKALSLAVDREALSKGIWGGHNEAPTAHHYKGRVGYTPGWKVYEHNPEKARQLVKEAGYDGTQVNLISSGWYYLNMDLAAQAVVKMWEKIGINAKVVELYRGGPRKKQKPIEGYYMTTSYSNPMYFPDMMGGVDPGWSPTSWTYRIGMHPEIAPGGELYELYIGLYKKARYEPDPVKRKKYYKMFVEFLEEEVTPFIIAYQPYMYMGMDLDIEYKVPENYRPYTFPFRAGDIKFK